ncbi:camp-dependent protein kinase catalytic subunit [Geranomyces michiganensis]|nr:camp-dependent protein kinase catalytic subunit [Geranomyces michiganensis]
MPNGIHNVPPPRSTAPSSNDSRTSGLTSSSHLYAATAEPQRSTRETSRAILESFGNVQTMPRQPTSSSNKAPVKNGPPSPLPRRWTLDRGIGKASSGKEDRRGSEEMEELRRGNQHEKPTSTEDFDDGGIARLGRSSTSAQKGRAASRYMDESSEGISELSNHPLRPLSKVKRPNSGTTPHSSNSGTSTPPTRKVFLDRDSAQANPAPATTVQSSARHALDPAGVTDLDHVVRTQLAPPAPRGSSTGTAHRIERAISVHQRGPFKYELGDFVLQKSLGQGAFAKVYLVKRNVDGKLFALKSMRKDNVVKMQQVQHVQNERHLMENLRNPFLVGLEATFQDSQHIFMIIDYMPGGDLFSQIQRLNHLDEPLARFYATEVAMALSYLHSENIVYRDLKPENVLLDVNGHAKLGDFGFAKVIDGTTKTFCGTPSYIPPEILLNKEYSSAVDWWSFGVLLFEMLSGFSPFQEDTATRTYERILHGAIQWPPNRTKLFTKPAEELIIALLVFSPFKRLGCQDESEIRDHPFFASVDWRAVKTRKQPLPVGAINGSGPAGLRRSASSGNGFLNDHSSDTGNVTSFEISAWRPNSVSGAAGATAFQPEMFKDF